MCTKFMHVYRAMRAWIHIVTGIIQKTCCINHPKKKLFSRSQCILFSDSFHFCGAFSFSIFFFFFVHFSGKNTLTLPVLLCQTGHHVIQYTYTHTFTHPAVRFLIENNLKKKFFWIEQIKSMITNSTSCTQTETDRNTNIFEHWMKEKSQTFRYFLAVVIVLTQKINILDSERITVFIYFVIQCNPN